MLLKALGTIDFIAGLILIFMANTSLSHSILIFFGTVLLIKSGIGLLEDVGSWIDVLAGIIFILLIFFPISWIICLIIGILLIQKGFFSFL